MPALLFGRPVVFSRTGYTGERGLEIFSRARTRASSGTPYWRRQSLGSSRRASPRSTCCGGELSAVLPVRHVADYPSRRIPRATPVGARARLHRQPGENRFSRRRPALPAQGQGALQIFGLLVDGSVAADMADPVYAATRRSASVTCGCIRRWREVDGDRQAGCAGRRARDKNSRSAVRNLKAAATAHTLPFDDPEKKKRMAVR